jgi:outer membrane protein OmpU
MKKFLLGTTALVGILASASFANAAEKAAPLTITLGGSVKAVYGLTNEDGDKNQRSDAFYNDSDVTLRVNGTAAAGWKYGGRLKLGTSTADTNNGERYMVFASGSAGRLEAGNYNGASDRMAYYAPNKFGTGGIDGDYKEFVVNNFTATSATGNGIADGRKSLAGLTEMFKAFDTDYASKVTYFTPRVAGFQFGASYAPDANGDKAEPGSRRSDGFNSTSAVTQGILKREQFQNAYELGLNYVNTFSGVGVALGATYVGAEAKKDLQATTPKRYEDLAAYQLGGQLSYLGWTLGGGYVFQGESGYQKSTGNNTDAQGYNLGLQYETGPFVVGASALWAENEGVQSETLPATAGKNQSLDVYSLGATYVVAPGLSTFIEGTMFQYEPGAKGTDYKNNDGTVVMLGTKLEF